MQFHSLTTSLRKFWNYSSSASPKTPDDCGPCWVTWFPLTELLCPRSTWGADASLWQSLLNRTQLYQLVFHCANVIKAKACLKIIDNEPLSTGSHEYFMCSSQYISILLVCYLISKKQTPWKSFVLSTKITYPSHFHQISNHDDAGGVFVPHHPPKVVYCLLHRSWNNKSDERLRSEGLMIGSLSLGNLQKPWLYTYIHITIVVFFV